jgi:double-strand break repair protein MRE11
VNYFGKHPNADSILVKPLLFQKGETKIALYGIGHIKDMKLHQSFLKGRVKFERPKDADDYFNILVIHQNRFKGNKGGAPYKNCIHYKMLPQFLNLVIWGHEHESIPEMIENSEVNYYLHQPGSTVATSLIADEAKSKHVGIYEVTLSEFSFTPVLLKYQRPLLYKNITIGEVEEAFKNQRVSDENLHAYLIEKIEDMIDEHRQSMSETNGTKTDLLPLVRMRFECTKETVVQGPKVEMHFKGRIANEGEILKVTKKRAESNKIHNNEKLKENFIECLNNKTNFGIFNTEQSTSNMKDLVNHFF